MRRNLLALLKYSVLILFTIILLILFMKSANTKNSKFEVLDNFLRQSFTFDRHLDDHHNHNHNHEHNHEHAHKHKIHTGSFFNGQPKNVDKKKIDWHDYKFIEFENARTGIGEHGKAASISKEEAEMEDKLFKRNGFNALLSDKISLNRSVPDIRHPGCRAKKYLSELPSVSVVVPFYNEHWSTLLRTVYSVINRSPPELLTEIILVDDCSTKEFLKGTLDHFVSENLPKVRVLHLPERSGLITARLAGAKKAIGDVLIFLDSHTEANVNWLPPLLEPIAENYKTCVCPFIDVVAWKTFEYRAQDEGARGAFDWKFYYKRLPLRKEDLEKPTEPFPSPVMAGGLFAISAKFFWELGGYDPGLDIWGGEQYELSFKIWQCGGAMYDAPCSRVGHIYRGYAPFDNPRKKDFLTKNYKRVAEVWMDEYKEYLYMRTPQKYKNTDAGDLTEQFAIREKLQCKPFKWFIENIAPDLVEKYPPIIPPDFASGTVKSLHNPSYCIDTLNHHEKERIGLYFCAKDHQHPQANQDFSLTWQRDIRVKFGELCWDVSESGKAPVMLFNCHGMQGNQFWRYYPDTNELKLVNSKRCLDADFNAKTVFVNQCDKSPTQRWEFGVVNRTALDNWIHHGAKIIS